MKITGIIWLHTVINKIAQKHQADPEEVEEVFHNRPRFQRVGQGNVAGEDLYSATGQTDTGRYLVVFFLYKRSGHALPISARDMSAKERKRYGRK